MQVFDLVLTWQGQKYPAIIVESLFSKTLSWWCDIWLVFRHVLLWVYYSCVDRTELNKKVFIIILSLYFITYIIIILHITRPPGTHSEKCSLHWHCTIEWLMLIAIVSFGQSIDLENVRYYILYIQYMTFNLLVERRSSILYFSSYSGLILQVPQHNYGKVMFRWD